MSKTQSKFILLSYKFSINKFNIHLAKNLKLTLHKIGKIKT